MPRTIHHPALAPLKSAFPNTRFLVGEFRDMVTVVVPREALLEVCRFLRDDPRTRFNYLCELNGVDYLNYPGAEHRFAVNYGLISHANNNRLWLKVFLDPTRDTSPGNAPRDEEVLEKGDPGLMLDSVTSIWAGAEWMEREVYDMFGVIFRGHPDLRRILTWNGFGSYPLRKDYPLRGVGERENYKIITREGA
ncbi:MAG: NADH-quinone oxidoreductase subunit C [Phycisphaerae bacterium]|nr:NADH-quinone oxidoreductase subunit C [Phycisphaerae bacterium]MDW8261605.1 NADH-quinone oxidoreductase subunit C [Phycisphaerales bacterium]